MNPTSTNESDSVFEGGRIKPGTYKILNVVGQTYVDIQERGGGLCGRPLTALEGIGLWEILPSGPGYTIRRIEPGMPEQFCFMLNGLQNESCVSVCAFPVAWRIEMVNERERPGRGCVRFFWGTTNMTWDLADFGSNKDFTPVQLKDNHGYELSRIWKLIPIKSDFGPQLSQEQTSVSLNGSSCLPSAYHSLHAQSSQDFPDPGVYPIQSHIDGGMYPLTSSLLPRPEPVPGSFTIQSPYPPLPISPSPLYRYHEPVPANEAENACDLVLRFVDSQPPGFITDGERDTLTRIKSTLNVHPMQSHSPSTSYHHNGPIPANEAEDACDKVLHFVDSQPEDFITGAERDALMQIKYALFHFAVRVPRGFGRR